MNAIVDEIITGHDLTFNLEFQRDEESEWFVFHVVELPAAVGPYKNVTESARAFWFW
jgi:hypothetical protein